MQNAINMMPSIPHSEKKNNPKLKRHYFFCSSQNYTDVEIKNPQSTQQKLFKGNLVMLLLFHSQITRFINTKTA